MAEDKRKDEAKAERPKTDEARREALAKMGRFAGYTAPMMLGLRRHQSARRGWRQSCVLGVASIALFQARHAKLRSVS
jgi:hypothetical protein